ncbi:serine/threonine-protein phosphatase 6 regulatory ankyrin repeat subunit B [Lingula anatina]|uniref:Serine/threonine-protein phosphatase 6 regulatory ankyrin repeat subunit B n=1 Tax=Lingula anatina TaxID=7574 RepID=A0A1S3IPX6_LINAN|nr:serine/threonine-protein phosphatase 6 regulatory ankyrin repeat subunit B [Lingula anatina]XP_013399966.1 serine/threonine-protein phosphatase 6 regulatory ankyrin repeat subunit B [Lingula anatina]|eukprot:XP_013399965.1 serine/threonine-protein phosphatase 6 regulatory ankyrin repeat subunit B [Lingula anatina]
MSMTERDIAINLISAIEANRVRKVEQILRKGPKRLWSALISNYKPHAIGSATVLHVAALQGNARAVELLLEAGADPNVTTLEVFQITSPNPKFWIAKSTPLHLAASVGQHETARILLKFGAKVDTQDKNGRTPLHLTCMSKESACAADVLLENRACLNSMDADGKTPLHYAAMHVEIEMVKRLLSAGADIDFQDHDGLSPLLCAIKYSATRVAKYLCACEANLQLQDAKGMAPLHWAAQIGLPELIHLFVGVFRVNVHQQDAQERTSLHVACLYGESGSATALLEYGADVNASAQNGYSPLHYAAKSGDLESCSLLLKMGANAPQKDRLGKTAADLARTPELQDLLQTGEAMSLLDRQASPDNDSDGESLVASGLCDSRPGSSKKMSLASPRQENLTDDQDHVSGTDRPSHRLRSHTRELLENITDDMKEIKEAVSDIRSSSKILQVFHEKPLDSFAAKLFLLVSKRINCDWKDLFRSLMSRFHQSMIVESKIEEIVYANEKDLSEQCYISLVRWRQSRGLRLRVDELIDALNEILRRDIAEEVENFISERGNCENFTF